MNLTNVKDYLTDGFVLKDAEFFELGLTSTRSPRPMLVFLENQKYLDEMLGNDTISCAVVTPEIAELLRNKTSLGLVVSDSPKFTFFSLHNSLLSITDFYGKNDSSDIATNANVHPTASISDTGVYIGSNSVIGPHVSIYPNVHIGNNVTIGANCVIGGDGFECFRYGSKALTVKHAGGVRIEDNVDIQASCCIDKGLFRNSTEIGEYTKLDNLVHIAHNVVLGRRVFIAATAMLAGRVTVGDDAWIGPGASVSNGITIGHGSSVSIGAVVTRDVAEGQKVSGNFAIAHDKFLQFIKSIR